MHSPKQHSSIYGYCQYGMGYHFYPSWQTLAALAKGKLRKQPPSYSLFYGVRLGFLSDWALIAAQAHGLYLVQLGNREQRYYQWFQRFSVAVMLRPGRSVTEPLVVQRLRSTFSSDCAKLHMKLYITKYMCANCHAFVINVFRDMPDFGHSGRPF